MTAQHRAVMHKSRANALPGGCYSRAEPGQAATYDDEFVCVMDRFH